MIKNNSGITLISLAIVIIIMIILIGVSLVFSYKPVNYSTDESYYSTLNIMQQAVIEQYEKAKMLNLTKIEISEEKPSIFIGTPIEYDNIEVYIGNTIDWESKNYVYYEDYYYRLTPEDLLQLNIKNTNDTFVVNYKTGEVYNETVQVTSNKSNLYINMLNKDTEITEIDKTFSDGE